MPSRSLRHVAFAASTICPPGSLAASKTTTSCPRNAETRAASSPAGPAPTTTTLRRGPGPGSTPCGMVRSRPVAGLCRQSASPPT